jgi:hypothetical protein
VTDFDPDAVKSGQQQRASARELWTTNQVAEHLGVRPGTFRDYRQRLDPPPPAPVSSQPGRGGQDLYDAAAVREWHANRKGRGHRSDLDATGGTQ